MVVWYEASKEVINIAQDLVEKYHQSLKDARIGFVFRSEAQYSGGMMVLGQASKVSDKLKPVLELDFLIWIAEDEFDRMDDERKRALIDHELTHCTVEDSVFKTRGHDVEEFHSIIQRYGTWSNTLVKAKDAMERAEQLYLNDLADGVIKALDVSSDRKVQLVMKSFT